MGENTQNYSTPRNILYATIYGHMKVECRHSGWEVEGTLAVKSEGLPGRPQIRNRGKEGHKEEMAPSIQPQKSQTAQSTRGFEGNRERTCFSFKSWQEITHFPFSTWDPRQSSTT